MPLFLFVFFLGIAAAALAALLIMSDDPALAGDVKTLDARTGINHYFRGDCAPFAAGAWADLARLTSPSARDRTSGRGY